MCGVHTLVSESMVPQVCVPSLDTNLGINAAMRGQVVHFVWCGAARVTRAPSPAKLLETLKRETLKLLEWLLPTTNDERPDKNLYDPPMNLIVGDRPNARNH